MLHAQDSLHIYDNYNNTCSGIKVMQRWVEKGWPKDLETPQSY